MATLPEGGATAVTPAISVVIPTRDRAEHLREALRALLANDLHDFEVRIMDQSDGDATHAVVRSFADPRLIYYRMPRPGACPARNFGAAMARAPLVAFLDDDTSPNADWLSRIVCAFASDPELQFIFGRLTAPTDNSDQGLYPDFVPQPYLSERRMRRRILYEGAGANMSARKEFLRRIGGFDELLGPTMPRVAGNDSSMCYKVFASGEKWIASPDIEVVHTHGFRTYEQWGRLMGAYAHGAGVNYGRFVRRGSLRAFWYWSLEMMDRLRDPLSALLHGRRPRGTVYCLRFVGGFIEGLRCSPRLGFFDGAEFRRAEATGRLDA
jgi:glycosyltransferase involved in cell wall biosynthesis